MADTSGESTPPTDALETSAHNFLTVPPEIFELIVEEVDAQDLLPMRLVSKETSQRVFQRVLKVHFTERAFLLSSEASLRTLLAIAEHETFSRTLNRIDFCTEEVPAQEHWYLLHEPPPPEVTKLQTRELALRTKQANERSMVVEQQKSFRSSNGDLHILTMALCRLREVQALREIRIVDSYKACKPPPGYAALENSTGQTLIGPQDEIRSAQLVMDAISTSLIRLESFIVRADTWFLPFFALTDFSRKWKDPWFAFRSLKKLHLDIDTGDENFYPEHPSVQQVNDFYALLNSTLGCEDLSIQIETDAWKFEAPDSYQQLATGIRSSLRTGFPQLVDLDLQGLDIPVRSVFSILPHLPKLLRFHFHAARSHSPYWRVSFKPSVGEAVEGKTEALPISQEELEAFTVARTGCLSVEVASCTLIECVKGQDFWANMLEKLNSA